MELREVVRAFRAFWWMLVTGVLLGGIAATAVNLLVTPQYTSHTRLFVSTTGSTSTSDVLTGSQFSQQRVASYVRLLTGEDLAARVIADLELDMTPEEFAEQVTASAVPETVLLDVTVTDPSPQRARDIAEGTSAEFIRLIRGLETPRGSGPRRSRSPWWTRRSCRLGPVSRRSCATSCWAWPSVCSPEGAPLSLLRVWTVR